MPTAVMTINGVDLRSYHARLVEMNTGGTNTKNTYHLGAKSSHPVITDQKIGARSMEITIEVEGDDRNDLTHNISGLTNALNNGLVDLYLPDGYYYFSILQSVDDPEYYLSTRADVIYTFDAVRHGAYNQRGLTAMGIETSASIEIMGNLETEVVYTITPTSNADQITVAGITVNNITADKVIVIDGINKRVTEDGDNKFGDCDLVSFPRLAPGTNTITFAAPGCAISVGYYPIYA